MKKNTSILLTLVLGIAFTLNPSGKLTLPFNKYLELFLIAFNLLSVVGLLVIWVLQEKAIPKTNVNNIDVFNGKESNLSKSYIKGCNFTNSSLKSVNLSGSTLSAVNLTNADLSNANLSGAFLSNMVISNTNFSNANLSNADLEGLDLSSVNISGANLEGAIWINGQICQTGSIGQCIIN